MTKGLPIGLPLLRAKTRPRERESERDRARERGREVHANANVLGCAYPIQGMRQQPCSTITKREFGEQQYQDEAQSALRNPGSLLSEKCWRQLCLISWCPLCVSDFLDGVALQCCSACFVAAVSNENPLFPAFPVSGQSLGFSASRSGFGLVTLHSLSLVGFWDSGLGLVASAEASGLQFRPCLDWFHDSWFSASGSGSGIGSTLRVSGFRLRFLFLVLAWAGFWAHSFGCSAFHGLNLA